MIENVEGVNFGGLHALSYFYLFNEKLLSIIQYLG